MSETIEARLAKLEREVAILKAKNERDKGNWIAEITGSFKDDSDFAEIVRLGKEMRDAEPPEGLDCDIARRVGRHSTTVVAPTPETDHSRGHK